MTRDEVLKRLVYIPATTTLKPKNPRSIRNRGDNFVVLEASAADVFDDFFDYEKELNEFPAARNTVSASSHLDEIENKIREPKIEPAFIMMEELPQGSESFPQIEDSQILTDESTTLQNQGEPKTFQFLQCEYFKTDGERCKKQAKKGQSLCSRHRNLISKEIINEE